MPEQTRIFMNSYEKITEDTVDKVLELDNPCLFIKHSPEPPRGARGVGIPERFFHEFTMFHPKGTFHISGAPYGIYDNYYTVDCWCKNLDIQPCHGIGYLKNYHRDSYTRLNKYPSPILVGYPGYEFVYTTKRRFVLRWQSSTHTDSYKLQSFRSLPRKYVDWHTLIQVLELSRCKRA